MSSIRYIHNSLSSIDLFYISLKVLILDSSPIQEVALALKVQPIDFLWPRSLRQLLSTSSTLIFKLYRVSGKDRRVGHRLEY
jgi:hypothetical protein